jgi:hypothetical protein
VTGPAQRFAALAALALILGTPRVSRAELSADDYGGGRAIRPESNQAAAQALIDAARRREAEQTAERERASQAAEARRLAEEAQREADRPPGERLAAQYCVPCHGPERIATARHTRLGWSFTVARMRYLNRAQIPAADARTIAVHLALTQPARTAQALMEYGLALALMLIPAGLMLNRLRCARRARRPRSTRGGEKSPRPTPASNSGRSSDAC